MKIDELEKLAEQAKARNLLEIQGYKGYKTSWTVESFWESGFSEPGVHDDFFPEDVLLMKAANPDVVLKLIAVVKAAQAAADEIDKFYSRVRQYSRKQTIWEHQHNLWLHRDEIQLVLKELENDT